MPVSKKQLKEMLEEDKRLAKHFTKALAKHFTKAEVGDLICYSLRGNSGPFKMALARQEDGGFVTSARHLDGSEVNFSYRRHVKRWVIPREKLTASPQEVLKELEAAGMLEASTIEDLQNAIKLYVKVRKE